MKRWSQSTNSASDPGAGSTVRRLIGWIGVFATTPLMISCPIVPPTLDLSGFPSDDQILECTVTVRNLAAEAGLGVNAVPEQTLSNHDALFLDGDGKVFYYLAQDCIAGEADGQLWGFANLAEAEADWSRFAQQRIQSEAVDPESESIFRFFAGTWCAVPDTLVCRRTDEPIIECVTRPEQPAEPLTTCVLPPPPLNDACLDVSCGAGQTCTRIEFGDKPVGYRASESVTLTNCGGTNAPPVRVTVDGTVTPVGQRSDFDISIADNTCHPSNGDGEAMEVPSGGTCQFRVDFEPTTADDHRGQTAFTSSARSGVHTIDLFGNGLPGELVFAVPGAPPGQIPEQICVDYLVDQCTASGRIDITNQGPGVIHITEIRLELNQGFELLDSPQFPLALTDEFGSNSAAIRFRWCGPAMAEGQATLVIDSDDQTQPTFALPLVRQPAGCNPDPTLLAAYGFEGTGSQVIDITGNGYHGSLQGTASRNTDGKFGAALEFTGTDGHVDVGTGLDLTGDQLTIALWMNADDFDVTQARFIARAVGRNPQQQYWQMGTAGQNGDQLRYRVKTPQGDTTTLESDPTLQPDIWTHVAATYDGTQMSVYKDGVLVAVAAKSGSVVNDPDIDVWIGDSPPNGTRAFDGRIDEIRIYERALDVQEIQQIMNSALIPIPGG